MTKNDIRLPTLVAKHMDRVRLDDVIRLLRNARNGVVWKLGQ